MCRGSFGGGGGHVCSDGDRGLFWLFIVEIHRWWNEHSVWQC